MLRCDIFSICLHTLSLSVCEPVCEKMQKRKKKAAEEREECTATVEENGGRERKKESKRQLGRGKEGRRDLIGAKITTGNS